MKTQIIPVAVRWPAGCLLAILMCAGCLGAEPAPAVSQTKVDYARLLRQMLIEKYLPYWYETTIDTAHGGYLLADDAVRQLPPASDKQLVSQSRLIWVFAHAHLKGLGDGRQDYLAAARQGYRFLSDHFRDPQHGGYYWRTDPAGKVLSDRKILYGNAFALYALVEYYRASGDHAVRQQALDLYQTIQDKLHDDQHEGWFEHAERDFQLVLDPTDRRAEVEVAGRKSANAHLHWMEALAELYSECHRADVRRSLRECVKINRKYFYPVNPGQSCFHRMPDWKPVPNDPNPGLSYGHNVEFAWLMIRAEQVLKRSPSWYHYHAIMDHAMKYGYDHGLGGLYNRGGDDQPATDKDKVWWVQAEMLAALVDGLRHEYRPSYSMALDKLLSWLLTYQILPADGNWIESTSASGQPKSTSKAHNWKAAYHETRGMVKFIELYLAGPTSDQTDTGSRLGEPFQRRKTARPTP